MKKTLFIVLAIALCLGLISIAMAGVSGTKHDPRVVGSGTASPGSIQHVCESCHTPHAASGYPLWNRNRTGPASGTFTMYQSPTFDETAGAGNYLAGAYLGYQSKLCFACHDGTASSIQNAPGSDPVAAYDITILNPNAIMGNGDLTNTHPVGFLVNIALDYNGGGRSGLNGLTITNRTMLGSSTLVTFPLYPDPTNGTQAQGTFQCATCHTVHHTPDISYDPDLDGEVYFLRVSNLQSQMCAECHPAYYY